MPAPPLPDLTVADADAWRAWLAEHHAKAPGVWLTMAKQGATEPTGLTYEPALQEALCYGWIDGQARSGDDRTSAQKFTPRTPRSGWSKKNVSRVERLVKEGRMQPAGHAAVDQAKADGRWEAAYAGPATMEMPADLAAALAANPQAQAMFDILTSQNRYAVLYRINNLKRADTRVRRIAEFVAMLARGETIHPQKRRLEAPPQRRTDEPRKR